MLVAKSRMGKCALCNRNIECGEEYFILERRKIAHFICPRR